MTTNAVISMVSILGFYGVVSFLLIKRLVSGKN